MAVADWFLATEKFDRMPRIAVKQVSTLPNTIDVVVTGETHTAAAAIVERLNSDSACTYAAYRIEHPTDDYVTIRVMGDETKTARDILRQSIAGIIKDINELIEQADDRQAERKSNF
ncbi:DNA-directed RNA polymerase II subunit RPB11 [Pancytospora philotis]|nr:DNA-directed RNA polymerase II subunit RPB11 [Pancytospora philotis]